MLIWGKELQVKEKKIKQRLIKLAEDVEDIVIIDKKHFVLIVVLEELQNYGSLDGEIDIPHLTEIKGLPDNFLCKFLLNSISFGTVDFLYQLLLICNILNNIDQSYSLLKEGC